MSSCTRVIGISAIINSAVGASAGAAALRRAALVIAQKVPPAVVPALIARLPPPPHPTAAVARGTRILLCAAGARAGSAALDLPACIRPRSPPDAMSCAAMRCAAMRGAAMRCAAMRGAAMRGANRRVEATKEATKEGGIATGPSSGGAPRCGACPSGESAGVRGRHARSHQIHLAQCTAPQRTRLKVAREAAGVPAEVGVDSV